MSKKHILINVALFLFCISVMSFGIYAIQTANLEMTGSVGFITHDCKVSVLGTISGAIRGNLAGSENDFKIVDTSVYTPQQHGGKDNNTWYDQFNNGNINQTKDLTQNDIWNFGEIFFDDFNLSENQIKPIIITLQITNKSDYSIDVTIGEILSTEQIIVDVPKNITILSNQTEKINITFALVSDKINSASIYLDQIPVTFSKSV